MINPLTRPFVFAAVSLLSMAGAAELKLQKAVGFLYDTRTHHGSSALEIRTMRLPGEQKILLVRADYAVDWQAGEDRLSIDRKELSLTLADGTRLPQMGWGVPHSKFYTQGSYMTVSVRRGHRERKTAGTSKHVLHIGFAVPKAQDTFALHVGETSIAVKGVSAAGPPLHDAARFVPVRAYYLPTDKPLGLNSVAFGRQRVPVESRPAAGQFLFVEFMTVPLHACEAYSDKPRACFDNADLAIVVNGLPCPMAGGGMGCSDLDETNRFPSLRAAFTVIAPPGAESLDLYYLGTKVGAARIDG